MNYSYYQKAWMCSSRKYPYPPPHGRSLEILRRTGLFSKTKEPNSKWGYLIGNFHNDVILLPESSLFFLSYPSEVWITISLGPKQNKKNDVKGEWIFLGTTTFDRKTWLRIFKAGVNHCQFLPWNAQCQFCTGKWDLVAHCICKKKEVNVFKVNRKLCFFIIFITS